MTVFETVRLCKRLNVRLSMCCEKLNMVVCEAVCETVAV